MKSLEIVDKKIKEIKDDEFWIELSKRELQQIQQDLEVLEIIVHKRVLIDTLKEIIDIYKDDEKVLRYYNARFYDNKQLTLEELLKLKQWLEVNEE